MAPLDETTARELANADSLAAVLLGDVTAALNSSLNEPGASRRNFVRSVFAAIEGYLWSVQQELLDITRYKLSEAERGYLQDKDTRLNSKGETEEFSAKTTLKQRVLLVANLVKRVRPECTVDLGTSGWADLMESLKLRDRLTHPKSRSDLDLSDDELRKVAAGLSFFVLTIVGTLRKGLAEYRTANTEQLKIEAWIKALRMFKPPVPAPITPLKT